MRDLRNRLARLPAIDGENGDNLLIALATYFDGSLDCPDEDEPGGWHHKRGDDRDASPYPPEHVPLEV